MRSNVESALVPSRLLGELLIEKGLITPEELEDALAEQKESGKRLGEILVKKGHVSGPALTTVLAEQLGVDMEKQTGFGSGLWSEIKRRHPRGGRVRDIPAEPETPREARLHVIDGLADAVGVMREPDLEEPAVVEEPQPGAAVEETAELRAELEALRQQLTFAGTRLDEERSAHEGTQRLLDEARVAQAEAADTDESADPAELATLNDTVVTLRSELEAREAELAESGDARRELESVMAELESDLNELRERHGGSDSANAELADKIRELRVENDEVKRRLIESRAAATAATDELAALKGQLDARADELATASDAQDRQLTQLREELAARDDARSREADARVAAETALAELRSETERLSQSLDEERAVHVATRRDVERLESRSAELTSELEAAKTAADAARSEAAESLDRERADAHAALDAERATLQANVEALSRSLDDERTAHAATRQEVERLGSRSAGLEAAETAIAELRSDAERLSKSLDAERAAHAAARGEAERFESRSVELTAELEAVRAELAERPQPPPVEEPPSAHIVFLPVAEGYALEARTGPAPEVGVEEELHGVHLRVARVGRSPLPADRRQCAFLEVA